MRRVSPDYRRQKGLISAQGKVSYKVYGIDKKTSVIQKETSRHRYPAQTV